MANLKQLSETLGLSQTTVSRALNGYPEVSALTRQRVIEAANRHNYTPNPRARGLATGKSATIGHVVPLSTHQMINPHFSDFIAGAGEVYEQRGYDMLISITDASNEAETYRKLKRDRRVDGVIVHGPLAGDPRIELLQELDIPFVVHGRTLEGEDNYNWVDVNNRRSFRQATQHLIELGHRRIALVNGFEHMVFAIKRLEGYREALQAVGIVPDSALSESGDMTEPQGYLAMRRFLDHENPPTAVLCASMLPAMGVIRAMQERGLEPGKDISVIAHDDCLSFLMSDFGEWSMTVMRSGIREAGRVCAQMLIDIIEGQAVESHHLLEAAFVKGTTTAPAP